MAEVIPFPTAADAPEPESLPGWTIPDGQQCVVILTEDGRATSIFQRDIDQIAAIAVMLNSALFLTKHLAALVAEQLGLPREDDAATIETADPEEPHSE